MRWKRGPEFAEEYRTYYDLFGRRVKKDRSPTYMRQQTGSDSGGSAPVPDDEALCPRFWNPETKAYDVLAEWDPARKSWVRPHDDLAP